MPPSKEELNEKKTLILAAIKGKEKDINVSGVFRDVKAQLNGKGLSVEFVRKVINQYQASRPGPKKGFKAKRTLRAQIKKDTMPFDVPSAIIGQCAKVVSLLRDHGYESLTVKVDGKFETRTIEVRGGQVQALS